MNEAIKAYADANHLTVEQVELQIYLKGIGEVVGEGKPDYFTFVKENWKNWFYGKANANVDFQSWWDRCLYDGVYEPAGNDSKGISFGGDVTAAAAAISAAYKGNNKEMELAVFESYAVGTGSQANNPLLQELPDQSHLIRDHYRRRDK